MEYKKNIVLTSPDFKENQKGVLSVERSGELCHFVFKGVNFLPKNRILGVYIKGNLYKFELVDKSLEFDIKSVPADENISVVVLDRQNMLKPFLWGSQAITENDLLCNKVIEEINIKAKNNEESIEGNEAVKGGFSFLDNLDSDHEKFQKAENFSREEIIKNEEEEVNKILKNFKPEIENSGEPEFYSMIADQVAKLLDTNETDSLLESIISDSRFVSVPKGNGEYYVFGVIYEDGMPKFLCYGEKGKFSEERPEHLKEYYQWLPIDTDNTAGDGYYMMYQDAKTGKSLEMTVI